MGARQDALAANTALGRVRNLAGWVLSIVCVYKILAAFRNVVFKRVAEDPITSALRLACAAHSVSGAESQLSLCTETQSWVELLSLLFVGYLVLSNTRNCIQAFLQLFRFISAGGLSSNLFAICLSQVMGMYFPACVLLMRFYIPVKARQAILDVLGTDHANMEVFNIHFDFVFMVSSLLSIAVILLARKFKQFNENPMVAMKPVA